MGTPKHARRGRQYYTTPRERLAEGDRQYDADELEFLRAVDRYKTENRRPWPTWGEVLAIAKSLGWKKD